jgi:diguanylate cyclase (GGDEF)-like protein
MMGRSGTAFIYPEDLEPTRKEMRLARLGQKMRNFESRYVHKDGRVVTLAWSGVWSEAEQKHFFIGRDRTELMRREDELEIQNRKLDAALTNMSQGLAMFNAEQRVIIANDRFAEMYGQSPDQVKPGTPLRSIVEHRISKGIYVGTTVDEVLHRMRERVARQIPSYMTSRMGDGRTITVAIRPQPEGGWVTTHLDITEREKLKDRLDAALNNMAQGLAMFDAQMGLVLCNRRYSKMYGLSPEQVQPGTSVRQILQYCIANGCYAGRDPDAMLTSTRKRLDANALGYYETKLADGRICGVSVMPMADGGVVTTHEDITERRRIEAHIAHLAHHDSLTNLPNRLLLRERLEKALAVNEHAVAVLYLDLDRFKDVNDTLGHSFGDLVLRAVGDRLRSSVHSGDFVARLGGDEFAVVHTSPDPRKSTEILADTIIRDLAAPYFIEGQRVAIETSIGIAVSDDHADPEQILKHSDLALYAAKSDGRGVYRFFEPEMDRQVSARRALEIDLREAVEGGQLAIAYQPIMILSSERFCGFEALLRWNHPQRGMIPPSDFIPLAEATGLIVPIGEWVLREACREAASWPAGLKVAVNLSAVQFKSPTLVQTIFSALTATGLAASCLELEITESVLLSDTERTLDILKQIHAIGVRVALDDFGSGYSSLSYLRSFPFDKIKVDRSFVRGIDANDPSSLAILRTVALLGRALGMVTTAEGVETEEQLARLRAKGFDEVQGYLLSRPLSSTVLGSFLARQPRAEPQAA